MKDRPSAEDQFFHEEEAQRRREEAWDVLQKSAQATRAEHAREKAVQLRRCPQCRIALEVTTLRGVEIDKCNLCKGIWLDEGELEQLAHKSPSWLARIFGPQRKATDKPDFG